MTAPRLTPDRPSTAYLLKLSPALLAQAQQAAASESRTLAAYIRETIKRDIARNNRRVMQ